MSQKIENAIGSYLESVAKKGGLTSYGELVREFDLPQLDGAWTAHPLAQIFEAIDHQDAATKRPFRTSVVVVQNTNMPGAGFFEALERLKGMSDPRTPDGRLAVWTSEVNAAHAYAWS